MGTDATRLVAVVDDDAEVRLALTRLLSAAGFATETFASGDEFVQSMGEHPPECVVLDLHMPGLSGFDVQERLAGCHPEVPVVVITADTAEAQSAEPGARAYLSKPVDGDALLLAIGQALHH
jgi:FixJ family two-component response regulator